MRQRNIALCIVLYFVTCGIYGIYWFIALTNEINEASENDTPSGGMAFLFSLITCGIYAIYWNYQWGKRLNTAQENNGLDVDSNAPILFLILSIFGLSLISWAIMQNALNQLAE